MVTSFGSPRRHVLLAVISTLSLAEERTRISPFTLRTRIHEFCGTRSLSVKASRSVWRDWALRAIGVEKRAPTKSRPFAALRTTRLLSAVLMESFLAYRRRR